MDVALARIIAADLSPAANRALIAETARADIAAIGAENRRLGAAATPPVVTVDGRKEASLQGVNPDRGVIVAEFEAAPLLDAVLWVGAALVEHSPRLTGAYAVAHRLFADGAEVDPGSPPPARSYSFRSSVPYARKIERGISSQAPDGVYQAVATLADRRFGNVARIGFTYEAGGQPAAASDRGGRRQARVVERASRVPAVFIEAR